MTIGSKITSAATPIDRVLVIGATSSLAQAICHVLARQGYGLILAGRDEGELDLLAADLMARYQVHGKTLVADLADARLSPAALIAQAGDFAHAVLAAGDMGNGDNADPANLAFVTHLNYVVPAQLATAAASMLEQKGSGSIVIISSVAGDRGRQGNYAYGSAKAALSAFASGLRNRMHKSGVHVMTVKPGFIDTPMTWGMRSPLIAGRDYAARKIVSAMHRKQDVVYVPFFWRFIMLAIQHIPERLFKRMRL